MGKDFDEITISSSGGEQLGSFGPNLADFGGGEFATGGVLICRDQAGRVAVRLAGGDDEAGGGIILATGGALHIVDFGGQFRVRIFSGDEMANQEGGTILLDAADDSGDSAIELNASTRSAVLRTVAGTEAVRLEVVGGGGNIDLRDGAGREVFQVVGQNAALYVGASGNEGDIRVRDGAGREVFQVDGQSAAVYVGASGNEGDVIVRDDEGKATIHLDGGSGDIILSNADAAEDFTLAADTTATPGAVMVLGDDGALRPCSSPYDRKVVGVIAGAGCHRPGIVLDRKDDLIALRAPISIVGKASCLADASFGGIEVGDLLTSSQTVGYAMRAADASRAAGATIGKALSALPDGRGLVEMVVSLH